MKYRILSALPLIFIVLFMVACSGGGGSSTTASTTSTGQVIDSPVVGLAYVCGGSSGVTDTIGGYIYTKGDSCTFSIGNVTVGILSAVPQDGIVTPQDIAVVLRSNTDDLNVLAVAQFLQSINSGATPGMITISSEVTAALSKVPAQSILTDGLCFGSTSATNCQTKLAALVSTATAGKNALVSAATAKAALDASMVSAKISNLKGLVPTNTSGYTTCQNNQFALCAGSICSPTGGKILVSNPDVIDPITGQPIKVAFDEMVCKCPVIGPGTSWDSTGLADVTGGNMNGSCAVPAPSTKYPNPIWSLFSHTADFPQQSATPNSFSSSSTATGQICPGTGDQMVTNCFSFLCTIDPLPTNGVTTASCYCPKGENLSAGRVSPGTPFYTEGGGAVSSITNTASSAKQAEACNYNPVGMPLGLPTTH